MQGATSNSNGKLIAALFLAVGVSVFLGKSIAAASFTGPTMVLGFGFVIFVALFHTDLAIILLLFAMLFSPEFSLGRIPGRNIVIRLEDIIVLGLQFAWLAKITIYKSTRLYVRTPINKYIIFYCAIFIFATARGIVSVGINPMRGFFYILKYLEYFMIFFLTVNLIKSKKQVKMFLQAMLLTFLSVNCYGTWQKIMDPLIYRVSAPFEGPAGEPNTLGGYQVLMLAITIGLILHVKSIPKKLGLLLLGATTLYPFLYTLSRSSYMALVVMYGTMIIFHRTKKPMLVIVLLFLVLSTILFLPKPVLDRIKYTFIPQKSYRITTQKFLGVAVGPSASARLESYKHWLKFWQFKPFLGYGVTGLGFIDGQYVRSIVELGVIGFFAFVFLIGALFRHTLRIYKRTKDPMFKGLAFGFLAGQAGLAFQALTANTYILIRIMEPFWFLAAMVMVIPHIEKSMEKNKEIEKDTKLNNVEHSNLQMT